MIRKTGNSLLSLFRRLKSRLNFDYCSKVRRELMSEVNKKRRLNDACDQLSARELEEQTETTLPYDHPNSSSCPTLGPITKETCAVPQTLTPASEAEEQTETTLPYKHSNSSSCPTLDPITKVTRAVPQNSTPVSENKSQC